MVKHQQHKYIVNLIRRIAICLFSSLWGAGLLYAAPLIHLTEPDAAISINEHIDVLVDPKGTLRFSDVTAPPTINHFAPPERTGLRFGFTYAAYWLRFSVQNHLEKDHVLWLEIQPPDLDEIQLFQLEHGNEPFKAIRKIDRSQPNAIQQYPQVIPLDASAGKVSTYYVRITSSTPLNMDLFLYSPSEFTGYAIGQAKLSSFTYGILFTLVLLNILLSVISRNSLPLSYSAYLLSLSVFLAAADGHLSNVFPWTGSWHENILYGFVCLSDCLALSFAYFLLHFYDLDKKWRGVIGLACALNIIAFICVFLLPFSPSYAMIFLGEIAAALILIGAPLHCYLATHNWFTFLILVARLWLILAIVTALFAVQGVVAEFNIARNWIAHVINFEAFLITIGLFGLCLQQQNQRLQEKHKQAVADAEIRARANILSRISHDIRTPISGVLGMTELLFETPLTSTQHDHLEAIQSSGKTLLNLVSNIHDRNKIDAGLMEIEKMPFDLAQLVNDCIDSYRAEAEEKSIELISHVHSDVPLLVIGDAARLRQILQHLLGNAFKYTEKGEIVLTVANDASQENERIMFIISDTGSGISKEDQKNLFVSNLPIGSHQQFQYGLGLSISGQLINKMDGEIGVESELGKGSKFWFSIALPAQHISKELAHDIDTGLRNKRMLVVDDNQTCRKVIQQQAGSWGMKVSTAHSGNEALAMIRAKSNLNDPFDIVIVDHEMPNMTGLQLAGKIQDELSLAKYPLLIMLTGLSKTPTQEKAREAGIRRVLTKPVTGKALKITLAEELNYIDSFQGIQNIDELKMPEIDGRPLTVMLVEDNPVSEKILANMLMKLDIQYTIANNGLQAVESYQHNPVDLILMDCEMPVMDGFEATRKIRQWEQETQCEKVPIIALTAHIMDTHKEHSMAVGMNAHLPKPVNIQHLHHQIKTWTIDKKTHTP